MMCTPVFKTKIQEGKRVKKLVKTNSKYPRQNYLQLYDSIKNKEIHH